MRSADGGGGAVLRLSPEVAERVRSTFSEAAGRLEHQSSAAPRLGSSVTEGAGELSGSIAAEADMFGAAWRTTLDVLGTSAALIAGNTNNLAVDLEALDSGLTIPDISGPGGRAR